MKKRLLCVYLFPVILLAAGCGRGAAPEENGEGGLSPEASLASLQTADGLEVSLFASEPLLSNPTNIDVDARGRVWVTEAYNYRNWRNVDNPYREKGDRIVILEDTDGDGRADTGKVFFQDTLINSAMGIAVLGNKVIVSCSPNVLVLTDTDGDDKADSTELLFTGIGGRQHDHAVHAFVFGPDGKLYFNFGNEGNTIRDKEGRPLYDARGRLISAEGDPYRQGMAFRCNPDGSGLEVLGHNFRNPYELAVDAYGRVWQTDNDDDGNRGTRVNFLLEYGNYGYRDEMTGASWREWRINREDSIPVRHWHQDDPGVVPNLLVNGSGSPSGLCIYEGKLLPDIYRGQMIHAEAGHNAVRVYPVKPDGAGFKAERADLLATGKDKWFRPVDVCVAPDGSLMVADWYDPGVGGHRVGDLNRGRIYRVAPPGHPYQVEAAPMKTADEAVKALGSPNQAVRYLAWTRLRELGAGAEPALKNAFVSSSEPRQRARAFWLLTKLPAHGGLYLRQGLEDKDERIRATAVRAARQMGTDLAEIIRQAVDDPSPAVRRTALAALHFFDDPAKPALWAELAARYDGKDPWYLEALGIAADGAWTACFEAWMQKNNGNWNTPAGRKIVWRARTDKALPFLAELAAADGISDTERRHLFRAFDFHSGPAGQQALLSLIKKSPSQAVPGSDGSKSGSGVNRTAAYALLLIDPESVPQTAAMKGSLEAALGQLEGRPEYIRLVARYKLKDKADALAAIAADTAAVREMREEALETLLDMEQSDKIAVLLAGDGQRAVALAELMGEADLPALHDQLEEIILEDGFSSGLKEQAVRSLGTGWNGSERLLALAEAGRLPAGLDTLAERLLTASKRPDILTKAKSFYNGTAVDTQLPDIPALLTLHGDAQKGATVFTSYCSSCHVVNGAGTSFGPELSDIGNKLSREALYDAVIHPDNGINFGFEGYALRLADGTQLTGYIGSETEETVSVKVIGGQTRELKKSAVVSRESLDHSLMPSGLGEAMGAERLSDLVAYLSGLKKTE